jgi:hypothetical protein
LVNSPQTSNPVEEKGTGVISEPKRDLTPVPFS